MLTSQGHFGAWWKAMRAIVGWLPRIRVIRRAVQATRTVRDRDLLVSAPLLVRPDSGRRRRRPIVEAGLRRVAERVLGPRAAPRLVTRAAVAVATTFYRR
jgi:hypothetical protein